MLGAGGAVLPARARHRDTPNAGLRSRQRLPDVFFR
nr:MAG TPA: hypothetical protein [Caudoviricetes sp.]